MGGPGKDLTSEERRPRRGLEMKQVADEVGAGTGGRG